MPNNRNLAAVFSPFVSLDGQKLITSNALLSLPTNCCCTSAYRCYTSASKKNQSRTTDCWRYCGCVVDVIVARNITGMDGKGVLETRSHQLQLDQGHGQMRNLCPWTAAKPAGPAGDGITRLHVDTLPPHTPGCPALGAAAVDGCGGCCPASQWRKSRAVSSGVQCCSGMKGRGTLSYRIISRKKCTQQIG